MSACALNAPRLCSTVAQAAHYNIELTDANQRDNMDDVRQGGTDEAVDVVRMLLHFPGADANVRIGSTSAGLLPYSALPLGYSEGATALHMAAEASLHEAALLQALLAGGAEVDARDASGATPLFYAASHSMHLTRCLLDAGASPLAADDGGMCALLQAAVCGSAVSALGAPTMRPGTWAMNIVRTDTPPRTLRKRHGWRTDGRWHFVEHEVDMAPLMTALMLTRIATPTGYAPDAPLFIAAHMATEVHGGDAAVTRMLRLAHAGVPLCWSRAVAHAFPDAFRAVVRALLLCRARVGECGLHRLDDACFDAVVARLARATVWPTLRCVAGGLSPWWEDEAAAAVQEGRVEDVSVFDFSTQSTS